MKSTFLYTVWKNYKHASEKFSLLEFHKSILDGTEDYEMLKNKKKVVLEYRSLDCPTVHKFTAHP